MPTMARHCAPPKLGGLQQRLVFGAECNGRVESRYAANNVGDGEAEEWKVRCSRRLSCIRRWARPQRVAPRHLHRRGELVDAGLACLSS